MKEENPEIISINLEKAYGKIQHPPLTRSSRSLRRDLLPTPSPCQVHGISTPSAVHKHSTPRREAAGSSLLSTCTHGGHALFAIDLCPVCTVILQLRTCGHTTNYPKIQWPQTVTPIYHLTASKARNLDRTQRGQRSQPEAGVGTSYGPSTPTWPWAALAGSGSEGSCGRSTLPTLVFSVWQEHGGSQPPRGLGGTSGVRVQANPWMGRQPLLPSNRDPIPMEATVKGAVSSVHGFPPAWGWVSPSQEEEHGQLPHRSHSLG